MATQLATIDQPTQAMQAFDLQQRQARMFALSPLVPESLRKGTKEEALANCYIALKLAEVMGEAPLVVMQNIHIVKGKAGFSAQYMIARANSSGIFEGRIDWRIDRSDPANLSITAFAHLKATGDEVSFTCDMKMASAEGWTSNAKYKSMPELMLRYRSATFLVRLYAPDVMLGYQTAEEYEDMTAIAGPMAEASPLTAAALLEQAEVVHEITAQPSDNAAGDGPSGQSVDEREASTDQQQSGEATTLESAKDELRAATNPADLNSRAAALAPLLNDDDRTELALFQQDRMAELKGGQA